jgi:5-methyltetrahydrofolate--homocysteine methyltransferase
MDLITKIAASIKEGEPEEVERLVREALEKKIVPLDIVNLGMIPALDEVGALFEKQEIFLPELLLSAKAMKSGMQILAPLIREGERRHEEQVVLGTVRGDLHDIGKNLVGLILEGSGYRIIDLGVDVSPEKFAAALKEHPAARVLGMSAMLTTTMHEMAETIRHLEAEGLRNRVAVLLGGAVITEKFAGDIKADGYAADAVEAKKKIEELVKTSVVGG